MKRDNVVNSVEELEQELVKMWAFGIPALVPSMRLHDALYAIWQLGEADFVHVMGRIVKMREEVQAYITRPDQAPPVFTDDQVASLNAFQTSGMWHPFTCVNDHPGDRDLVATAQGWVCPGCSYTQNWAHQWMGDWSWKTQLADNPVHKALIDQTIKKLSEKAFRLRSAEVIADADNGIQTAILREDGSIQSIVGLGNIRYLADPEPDPLAEINQ